MSGLQLSIRVRSEVVQSNFAGFANDAERSGEAMALAALMQAKEIVSTPPPEYAGEPEHYWASARQRAFVMMNWEGPYQRTGRLEDSWVIDKTKSGYRLRSTYPTAKYVVGSATSPDVQYYLHRGRWVPVRIAVEEAIQGLPAEIQEGVSIAARRRGFSR